MAASKINHTVIATACSVSKYTLVEVPYTIKISIEKYRSPIPLDRSPRPCVISTNGMIIDRCKIYLVVNGSPSYKRSLNKEMICCPRFYYYSRGQGQGVRVVNRDRIEHNIGEIRIRLPVAVYAYISLNPNTIVPIVVSQNIIARMGDVPYAFPTPSILHKDSPNSIASKGIIG